jgi:hypothetical protein
LAKRGGEGVSWTQRLLKGAIALPLLIMFAPAQSEALQITFDLNVEFSGATPPAGTPPWLRATFDDGGGSGSVTLTLTALNLTGTEFVTEWDFNSAVDPTTLTIVQNTGPTATISQGSNAFQADGDGLFDIEINFASGPPAARFGSGDTATFTITDTTITANTFNLFSAPGGGHGPFHTAAHVQGIGTAGNDSGWIGDTGGTGTGTGTPVPEPSSLFLLGGGLVGLGFVRRFVTRRRP